MTSSRNKDITNHISSRITGNRMSEQANLGTLPTEVQLSIIRHLLRFNQPMQLASCGVVVCAPSSAYKSIEIALVSKQLQAVAMDVSYGESCFAIDKAEDLTELPYLNDGRDRITHVQINFGPSFIASIAWSALSPQERELADYLQCMSRLRKIDIVAKKGEAYWHYGAGRSAILVVVAEKLSHVKQVNPVGQSAPWLNGNAYEWLAEALRERNEKFDRGEKWEADSHYITPY